MPHEESRRRSAYLRTSEFAGVLDLELDLDKRPVEVRGGGRALGNRRRLARGPCSLEGSVRLVSRLRNRADAEVRVLELGVAQAESELEAGLDVALNQG